MEKMLNAKRTSQFNGNFEMFYFLITYFDSLFYVCFIKTNTNVNSDIFDVYKEAKTKK